IARRAGRPLLRFHPPRARQRTGRPALWRGQLRFQTGSGSAAGPRVRGLGVARSLRFHTGRGTPGQRKPAASREPDWATTVMSQYVVMGGAGFIGFAIVRKLLEEGARRVVAIDNLLTGRESNLEEVRRLLNSSAPTSGTIRRSRR